MLAFEKEYWDPTNVNVDSLFSYISEATTEEEIQSFCSPIMMPSDASSNGNAPRTTMSCGFTPRAEKEGIWHANSFESVLASIFIPESCGQYMEIFRKQTSNAIRAPLRSASTSMSMSMSMSIPEGSDGMLRKQASNTISTPRGTEKRRMDRIEKLTTPRHTELLHTKKPRLEIPIQDRNVPSPLPPATCLLNIKRRIQRMVKTDLEKQLLEKKDAVSILNKSRDNNSTVPAPVAAMGASKSRSSALEALRTTILELAEFCQHLNVLGQKAAQDNIRLKQQSAVMQSENRLLMAQIQQQRAKLGLPAASLSIELDIVRANIYNMF